MRDSCITVGVRHTHTRRDGGKTVRMDFGASSVVPSVQTNYAIRKIRNNIYLAQANQFRLE